MRYCNTTLLISIKQSRSEIATQLSTASPRSSHMTRRQQSVWPRRVSTLYLIRSISLYSSKLRALLLAQVAVGVVGSSFSWSSKTPRMQLPLRIFLLVERSKLTSHPESLLKRRRWSTQFIQWRQTELRVKWFQFSNYLNGSFVSTQFKIVLAC